MDAWRCAMKTLLLILAGILFSAGLTLGGMTDPKKVISFLDFFGNWDPSLLFVLGGAVVTFCAIFHGVARLEKPIYAPSFEIPQQRKITLKLILGAALFGIGWGITGLCPGPSLVSMFLSPSIFYFVIAMGVGMGFARYFD